MEKKDVLHLKNFTEILVDETLDRLWSEMDEICKCEKCRYDTKAIALNNLPPKYTVTQQGEVLAKLNNFRNQVQVDLIKEVLNATLAVNKNCSHCKDKSLLLNIK